MSYLYEDMRTGRRFVANPWPGWRVAKIALLVIVACGAMSPFVPEVVRLLLVFVAFAAGMILGQVSFYGVPHWIRDGRFERRVRSE
jgi:DMSO reductase anchor subunit